MELKEARLRLYLAWYQDLVQWNMQGHSQKEWCAQRNQVRVRIHVGSQTTN